MSCQGPQDAALPAGQACIFIHLSTAYMILLVTLANDEVRHASDQTANLPKLLVNLHARQQVL